MFKGWYFYFFAIWITNGSEDNKKLTKTQKFVGLCAVAVLVVGAGYGTCNFFMKYSQLLHTSFLWLCNSVRETYNYYNKFNKSDQQIQMESLSAAFNKKKNCILRP